MILYRLLEEKHGDPCLARIFPLLEAAEAHRYSDAESVLGKVVSRV